MARIRAIERFIAEREIRDDIALDGDLKQRPLKPRRITQMTARDMTRLKPQRNQHVAAKALDQRQAFAVSVGSVERSGDRPLRQALEHLLNQCKALLDFTDANPDARIDVARGEHGNGEIEPRIWRIAGRFARVKISTAGASDKSWRAETARQRAVENARRGSTVLQ